MQQYRDTDYAAVSAALHAREAKLLTQAMAERMIDAATPEESYKTLLECGYAPLERCTLENVEHALSKVRRELYHEVSVLAPDKRIIELFQVKYDYHNAKLALKSKRTGEDVSRLAMDCGRFDAQKVLRGETSAVSAAMSRAMAQAESEAGHSGDLRMAELLLDRACYEEMSALASETGSTFLKDYVALQIDASTCVRSCAHGAWAARTMCLLRRCCRADTFRRVSSKVRAAIIYRRSHTARRLTARASSRPNCLTAAGA